MKILHLTDYLPDYPGNFGHTLIEIARQITINDGKFFVSFPEKRKWHNLLENFNCKIIYIKNYPFKQKKIDTNSIKIFNRLIKQKNIDVVHVHFGLSQKITTIFLKILNPNLKIIWHWRGDIDDNISITKKLLILIFYRLMDFFVYKHITNSINVTKRLINKKIINKNKIYTLPNSINVELFKKEIYSNEINELSKKFNTEKIFTLLMIRNFRKRVDFNIILEAMELLKEQRINVQLIWIGYGETEGEIKEIAKSKKLNNIKFLGKISNPIPYYFISKINIIAWEPWCNETINNSVYEALACKIPVIGFNFGGLPLAFREKEGVIFSNLDPKDYANKILFTKKNYQNVLKSVEFGYEKVKKLNSLEAYVNMLINIYTLD